jgi:hypothetical protein
MNIELNIEYTTCEYFNDIFSSFKFLTSNVNTQLEKDYERVIVYINYKRVNKYAEFKNIINSLLIPIVYKKIAWCIPTQVSYFIFYKKLTDYFLMINSNFIVAELNSEDRLDEHNGLIINYDFSKCPQSLSVNLSKNFKIVEVIDDNIINRYLVYSSAYISIGRPIKFRFSYKPYSKSI